MWQAVHTFGDLKKGSPVYDVGGEIVFLNGCRRQHANSSEDNLNLVIMLALRISVGEYSSGKSNILLRQSRDIESAIPLSFQL